MKRVTELEQKGVNSVSIADGGARSKTAAGEVGLPDGRRFSCDLCSGLSRQALRIGRLSWMVWKSLHLPSHETDLLRAETGSKGGKNEDLYGENSINNNLFKTWVGFFSVGECQSDWLLISPAGVTRRFCTRVFVCEDKESEWWVNADKDLSQFSSINCSSVCDSVLGLFYYLWQEKNKYMDRKKDKVIHHLHF